MLNSLYDVFTERFPDRKEAWDKYLEFIAVDHNPTILTQLTHKFEWLLEDSNLVNKIIDVYKPQLLKTDRYDHLGEIYINSCLSPEEAEEKRCYVMPRHEALRMASLLIRETQESISIFDPRVGSGRLLLAGYGFAPNAYFFGVDNDNRMVRITYTNMLIHRIKGCILHADTTRHEIEVTEEDGRYNWKFANRWQSHIDQLKPRVERAQGSMFENGS